MKRRFPARSPMLMDACVLIDFIKVERALLELVVKHVGPLFVASPVVDEVNDIKDENELVELGIIIVEPELEDAFTAAAHSGPISFQDRLCLLTAKRQGFICVTNDKSLRKVCDQEGVPLLWGLQLLAEVYNAGGISAVEAELIAVAIQRSNPMHITDSIVLAFKEIIHGQKGRRSRS